MSEYEEDGSLHFQAQSPDEEALLTAARNFGYVYKVQSDPDLVLLGCSGKVDNGFRRIIISLPGSKRSDDAGATKQ